MHLIWSHFGPWLQSFTLKGQSLLSCGVKKKDVTVSAVDSDSCSQQNYTAIFIISTFNTGVPGNKSLFVPVVLRIERLVKNEQMDEGIILCILINTLILAFDAALFGAPRDHFAAFPNNFVFTVRFI